MAMHVLWAVPALVLVAHSAGAAVIGGPLLREGIEVVPSAVSGMALDRSPVPGGSGADAITLVADIHAARDGSHGFGEHAFIPYLSISYALTKDDAPTLKKAGLLYPIATKSGPRYGAPTELAGAGTYHLTYIVSPPSAHNMLRRTDKAGGVPDWWKPVTANWTFTYPLRNDERAP
jgi:hypothetical protein